MELKNLHTNIRYKQIFHTDLYVYFILNFEVSIMCTIMQHQQNLEVKYLPSKVENLTARPTLRSSTQGQH